ncbi:MAG: P-loop NTPase [Desulfarculaceae bacterium]|jgi:flagellar biosynthesis protein FlhG
MGAKIKKTAPVVLPVAGGKGGIGKSALAANLALALARLEQKTVLVDADLGGSDLHNLLGLPNDLPGLGEVLTSKDLPLAQVVHPVLEPGLGFVPGDAMLVATANPSFQKKRKLLHSIKKLKTDFIIMDLGAGTSITVMDFFLTSPLSMVVMLPERPALLNCFNFLKNALFRALDRIFRRNNSTEAVLKEFRSRSRGPGAMKMVDLVQALDKAQPGQGARAKAALDRWRPKLVLNRVRLVDDFVYAGQLERWAREDLGLNLEVLGLVPEDDILREAAAQELPALELNPRSPFCRAVALMGFRISQWAGRPQQWAALKDFAGSFERAATEYAQIFPPPGTALPTREELLRRLKELEAKFEG